MGCRLEVVRLQDPAAPDRVAGQIPRESGRAVDEIARTVGGELEEFVAVEDGLAGPR